MTQPMSAEPGEASTTPAQDPAGRPVAPAPQRSGRASMSIGQVLAALKAEFSDVSVSKIRFLESEGLIEPSRTASGYRKFGPADVERLRTILKLQRDSYLPLKVIREYLAALDAGQQPPVPTAAGGASSSAAPAAAPAITDTAEHSTPVSPARPPEPDITEPAPMVHLTESDLADQAGLEIGQVRALRDFGVICEHTDNGSTFFDGDDLTIATIARDLLKRGLDARHLKTLRRSAEQEAGWYEQLVTPSLRSRKAESRKQGTESVRELTGLSQRLRHAYLRQSLRDLVTGDG